MSKDNTNEKHHGNSLNAFMWGAIVGSGLTYILSHKRGRAILKELSENGLEALEGVLAPENLHKWKDEITEEIDHFKSGPESASPTPHETPSAHPAPQPRRRFFRRTKK